MNGKCKLEKGCKVVAIMDGDLIDSEMSDIEAGDTFEYRGENPKGLHQFGPDYDRYGRVGGLTGFQMPEREMDSFHEGFRVLAPDNLAELRDAMKRTGGQ